MTMKNACPICGAGHLARKSVEEEFSYKGFTGTYEHKFSICDVCHVDQAGPEEMKLNKRAVIRIKKTIEGLLTGEEVLQMRKNLGINQEEASKIFGGGPVAFSKYEKDDVMQSAAMDNIFRLAMDVPGSFEYLCKRSGVAVRKVNANWTRVYEDGLASFDSNEISSHDSAWEKTDYKNNLVLATH